jgi:hypothetical protein
VRQYQLLTINRHAGDIIFAFLVLLLTLLIEIGVR